MAQKFGAIVCRGTIVDRTVRPAGVVVIAEVPGETLGFEHTGEQLAVQAFIAEATVEAFVNAVLPRAAGLDETRGDARFAQPRLEVFGDKLAAIVAAQVTWWPMPLNGRLQRRHNFATAHPSTRHDVEVVVAVLIEECQELHRRAALRGVEDDIDAPDVVNPLRLDLRVRPWRTLRPHGRTNDLQAGPAAALAARCATRSSARAEPQSPLSPIK